MKIAFCGTQGTGKTTLSKLISEKTGYNYIPELARIFDVMNNKPCIELQRDMLYTQILIELWNKNFISDRSSLDYLVYAKANSLDINDNFKNEALDNMSSYDHIFYIPIMFDLIDDGYRAVDKEYQIKVDKLFIHYLEFYNIKHHIIKSKSIKGRIKEVLRMI